MALPRILGRMAVAEGSRLAGLARDGVFTWDDLHAMPEDGFRWELVDGQLLVTASPAGRHQYAVAQLHLLLHAGCPDDVLVMVAPYDWVVSRATVFVPDLMVVRRDEFDPDGPFTGTPLLVIEVRSPSTAATDQTLKRQKYEQHGASAYWLVDPGGPTGGGPDGVGSTSGAAAPRVPSLTALRLRGGAYVEEASVAGDEPYEANFPFPVTVVPGHLVAPRAGTATS
ncbi:MAG TPA: Uma2 family endonuclease [Acidimicrobiales bacterium]